MKHAVHISAGLLILLLAIQPFAVQGSSFSYSVRQWVDSLTQLLRWRPKRSCTGYFCSYSHVSKQAGSRAKHIALMKYLHSCARDPKCAPGKRRKRSTESLREQPYDVSRQSPFLHLLRQSLAKS